MGRPSAYTPEEDAIILTTENELATEVNRRLVEAGYSERTPNAIKQRRAYLRKSLGASYYPTSTVHGTRGSGKTAAVVQAQDEVARLALERAQLLTDIERMADELRAAQERLAEVQRRMVEVLVQAADLGELDALDNGGSVAIERDSQPTR